MREIPLNIVGGTTFARYPKITVEKTVNMMVSSNSLVPYAGYKKVLNFPSKEQSRQLFRSTRYDHMLAIVGKEVFTIDKTLARAKVGDLETFSGEVYISENIANQIAIVDGTTNIYIFNYSNDTFTKITVAFNAKYIDYQDGYLIAVDDTDGWHLSAVNDATSWPPLDVQRIQTKADTIVAAVNFKRQLFVIGEKITEIWHDQGLELFPYLRDNSAAIGYGCLSRQTIAQFENLLVWLASNEQAGPTIVMSTGGIPQSLSQEQDGLDFILDKLVKPENSSAFLFEEDGHIFYHITFFSDNFSIVYDFATKLYYTITGICLNEPHIAQRLVFFNDTHYFISFFDSNLYEMSTEITTYDGEIIPRYRTCPTLRNPNDSKFIVKRMTLQMENGINDGISRVSASYSKDGGYTFGTTAHVDLAPLGTRQKQIKFHQLGGGKNFTPNFGFWGDGRFVITNGTIGIMEAHT